MPGQRQFSTIDRMLSEVDHALRTSVAEPHAYREIENLPDAAELKTLDRLTSARLMRVNHAGEVAAQALYRGQALVARSAAQRAKLYNAANEEHDHLAWCDSRVKELGERVSWLTPAWYAGSFAIGLLAGAAGDRISNGFIAETEHQVERHLTSHLDKLPEQDTRSRRIVEQMRSDEIEHGQAAEANGAARLPTPIKGLMKIASRVMTTVAYRI